jgi:hypothetical protein
MEIWNFEATNGESIVVRMGELVLIATGFCSKA